MTKGELSKRWHDPAYTAVWAEKLYRLFSNKALDEPADFRGLVVGLDGALAEHKFASLDNADIELVDFGHARFSCSFAKSTVSRVRFSECFFDTCDMSLAQFMNCDFRASRHMAPAMNDTRCEGCNFSNADFKGRGMNDYGG